MTKPKSSKMNELLAAIQQKAPTAVQEQPEKPVVETQEPKQEASPRRSTRSSPAAASTSRVGKPVQFWLHDEDRKLVRELAAWLAGQGLRPTDSMVIRSALRTAKTGGDLLSAYRQAAELDGRLKQHKQR